MIYSKTITFVNLCRSLKETHFTRIRKMSLDNLMLSVLFRKGTTLHMELRSFKNLLSLKDTISKVGYLKQRLKLNPVAFLALARHHAENFYKDTHMVKKKNGFLIFAADGSALNIPTTEENLTTYGNASKRNVKPQAQLSISCLYDTINKMIVDCSINRWKFSTIYLSNIMNDIMLEAQMELEQEEHCGKHAMAINKNIAIGVMKEDLIHFILEKNDQRRKELMVAIVNEIKRNLLPIRKGRHYPRTKGLLAGNYSNTRKKSY